MATKSLLLSFVVDDVPATHVAGFREERRLGRPPELWVSVEFAAPIGGDELVGHNAAFALARVDGEPRQFVGVIESVSCLGTADVGDMADHFELHVVTPLSLLQHVVSSEIFQDKDVQQVVTEVLTKYGVDAGMQHWRLTGSYPKREYCVQYNESVFDFVSRLLEQEGIFYYTELSGDGIRHVFADDSTALDPLAGGKVLPYRPEMGGNIIEDHVLSVDERHRVMSGKFVLRDYDFTRPELDMTVVAEADVDTELERYDYPGSYVEPSEGKRLAQVRLEAEQVARRQLLVTADCPRLRPGYIIAIEDALHDDINGDYLVVATSQELVARLSPEQMAHVTGLPGAGTAREEAYQVRALLLPSDVKYRSPAVTPRPIIHGPQTATVVAPAGAKSEEIHTDEWGRSKVRFHWDRSGISDDKASCWMRTKQMQSSGSMVLPRVGWEVVVEYREGDPDLPFVTGRMYNGIFMPPYSLPEGRSRTALRSNTTPGGGGSNEVRFEDKAGGEEIYIHAQYDMTVIAANNKTKSVLNNESKTVAVDSSLTVGADQSIQVTMGNKGSVGADQTLTVGGNRNVEVNALQALNVAGNSVTSVGGSQFEMDGDPLTALVDLAVEKATELAKKKAQEALKQVDAYVQGKVDQVMGPIEDMQQQVGKVADAMDAVSQGQLGEVTTAMREAAAVPQVGEVGAQMREAAFGLNQAAGQQLGVDVQAPAADAQGASAQTGLDQLANGVIERGTRAAGDAVDAGLHDLFGEALGLDGSGGGGSSMPNEVGPELDIANIDETDREKGPGHSLNKVDGNLTESAGALKVVACITGVNTEVAGNMDQKIGVGRVEMVFGNRTEEVDGNKDETCVGLIVLSKGDVSEKVSGNKTTMVGAAIVDMVKGNHTVEAGGPATMIGALHKVTASSSITFKVGGSEVVIDNSGVTFKAPIIAVLSPKIQLTKKVAEN